MINPFIQAVPVLEKIELAGFEAYFVGGAVRDFILGRPISDVDIATSAYPDELKKIFPKTTDVGIEHGTILVHYQKSHYEVTTFRAESVYSDFRRPDHVAFIRSLREDLQRRDFTMNAIAMDKNGNLIDPFGGKDAIIEKKIITVGKPDERFGEDALRMLRAVRFLSQLSFKLDLETLESLKRNASLLEHIAVERILTEFEKMIQGPSRNEALRLLVYTGVYSLLPGMEGGKEALLSIASRKKIVELELIEMWSLLLFELGIGLDFAESYLRKWKLPLQKIKKIKRILFWLYFRNHSKWEALSIYRAGIQTALHTEKIRTCIQNLNADSEKELTTLFESLPITSRSELKVTGRDLQHWLTRSPGPWIGDTIEQIELAVIHHELENENDRIEEWVRKCNLK